MNSPSITSRLLRWYRHHARALPWRTQRNPYRVWISEVMLQQTRVDSVIPYYRRWMTSFPTVQSLARASESEVLAIWEGLGYYARARNLRQAARRVVTKYGGDIPADLESLRSLPGIGRYTAGAIASIAFGLDTPVLDGNVRRVLARVFDVSLPADSGAGERQLWRLAEQNLPPGRAADYNQALMDLGATVCLPRDPDCAHCPLRRGCQALEHGTTDSRPVLRARRPTPVYDLGAAVVLQRGRVLLAKRQSEGLLGGLWEFPNARITSVIRGGKPSVGFAAGVAHFYGLRVRPDGLLRQVSHAYTHFRVRVQAHSCELIALRPKRGLRWVRLADLAGYPMGKVDRQIALSLTCSGRRLDLSRPPRKT